MNGKKVHLSVLFLALLCLSGTLSFMSSCSEKNKAKEIKESQEQITEEKITVKSFEVSPIDSKTVNRDIVSFTSDGRGGLIIERYVLIAGPATAESLIIKEDNGKILIREDIDIDISSNCINYYKIKAHIAPLVKGKHYSLTLDCNGLVVCKVDFIYKDNLKIKYNLNTKSYEKD